MERDVASGLLWHMPASYCHPPSAAAALQVGLVITFERAAAASVFPVALGVSAWSVPIAHGSLDQSTDRARAQGQC